MLTWISEKAKWVIYAFILFILAGLMFMDMGQLQMKKNPPVGEVNGVEINSTSFMQAVDRVHRGQDQSLTDAQIAQIRREIFNSFVQRELVGNTIKSLGIRASAYEMMQDLRNDPPEGVMQAPIFQTDSQFDHRKYEAWLSNDSIYDDPQMLAYESNLREEKIPLKQLKLFVDAGFHPTSLEARFNAGRRETRATFWVAAAPVDSFPLEASAVSDAEVRAWFEANPDSFLATQPVVQVQYLALPVRASALDTEYAHSEAEKILEQLKDGADFAEMASVASEDTASARQGGLLGDFTARGQWVKPFEDAAFALDSGAISGLVVTPYGYHILKSEGKHPASQTDTVERVKIRHILVRVYAGNETIDSLEKQLLSIKEAVDQTGDVKKGAEILAAQAKAHGLQLQTSPWFARSEGIPGLGFLPGLASYCFGGKYATSDKDEIASNVLQSKTQVALVLKVASVDAGKPLYDKYKDAIQASLLLRKRLELAKSHLEKTLPLISQAPVLDSAFRVSLSKVHLDSMAQTSLESFVPSLGYASPVLGQIFAQAPGTWGPVLTAERSAVAAKVLSVSKPDSAAVDAVVRDELAATWRFGSQALFNDWMGSLQQGAKIVDNLDLYYRE